MEYGFDKFISWGHKKHQNYDIDFQPLPSPQFKINYKENSSQNILFVSTGTYYFVPKYVAIVPHCFLYYFESWTFFRKRDFKRKI